MPSLESKLIPVKSKALMTQNHVASSNIILIGTSNASQRNFIETREPKLAEASFAQKPADSNSSKALPKDEPVANENLLISDREENEQGQRDSEEWQQQRKRFEWDFNTWVRESLRRI